MADSMFAQPNEFLVYPPSTVDVILRSSNGVSFYVHRARLIKASPVFQDMFDMPQPVDSVPGQLPVVDLPDTDDIVDALLRWIYPRAPKPIIDSWERMETYFVCACKYSIKPAIDALATILKAQFMERSPARVYGFSQWLRRVHGVHASNAVCAAKRYILQTDYDLREASPIDLEFLSSSEFAELIGTQRLYQKAIGEILSCDPFWACPKCRGTVWRIVQPYAMEQVRQGQHHSPIYRGGFSAVCAAIADCENCAASITTNFTLARMDKDLLGLWEDGSYGDMLQLWMPLLS
ncbi:hypothetical protein BOTBODRAFT_397381 [Botryobasidium botryosum FD-172 SS1]|uniref:BTB domain-containing protein n=1 Tax=Botryobasidium botryosum (strain FD-172 SS1) TaxID=930990 RepID=A0A067MBP4_BOTB1|nr:hypothetical protein BOTBODRAFT_397381 [Botryobasidium botryosum FD-172 SS1]